MCDIHVCDKVMMWIVEAGPIGLVVVPPEIVLHLDSCEECMKKLTDLIMLSVTKPASEMVM